MPVTAKLSRAFYERFGDEIAKELVSWLDAIELTYRTELRDLNERNFVRFDRIDERLTRIESRIRDAYVDTFKWMFVFTVGSASMVLAWLAVGWLTGH
jgi:hypothetical protein